MQMKRVFIVLVAALMILPWQAAHAEGATIVAVVRSGGADVLDAPDGNLLLALEPGTVVTPVGKSADAAWVLAAVGAVNGWIVASRLIIVTLPDLPVVEAATAAEDSPPAAAPNANAAVPGGAAPPASAVTPEAALAAEPVATPEGGVTGRVITEDTRLNVRSGPGVSYAVVGKAAPGEELAVTGVSRDGLWLRVARIDLSGGSGWVAAEFLALRGDVEQLPVADAEASAAIVQTASPRPSAAAGPAGTLVFQASPGGMIYAYDLGSGALRSLTTGFDPAISPDGGQVAFTRDGGSHGLYLIGIDGRNEHLIFNGRDQLGSPKWSPDGTLILFVRGDEREDCILMGGRCMSGGARGGPGGGSLELPEDAVVTQLTLYKLALVDVNGGNYRDVPSLDTARAPDWTTAGIVYQTEAGMQRTADAPSAASELVITDPLKPYFDDPAQQPNGGLIVYQGKEASHTEIFTVNQDGSGVAALTHPRTTLVDELPSNVAPAWSPDGQQIVFLSNREENGEAGSWRLWVMDADGSNQRALPIDVTLTYTYGAEQAVSWGPAMSLATAQ